MGAGGVCPTSGCCSPCSVVMIEQMTAMLFRAIVISRLLALHALRRRG